MASILCSKCNSGIHYHSEPQGIQYVYIKKSDWEKICNSRFDSESKEIDNDGYPRLYRTDTLEDDFRSGLIKVWRCPNCGSIMTFDDEGRTKKTFCLSSESAKGKLISEGIAFDDYSWATITDESKPNAELKNKQPSVYVKVYEGTLEVSVDDTFDNKEFYLESSRSLILH